MALPALAGSDLGAPCHLIGDEAAYTAAFEAAGWQVAKASDLEEESQAALAVGQVLTAVLLFPNIGSASGYDAFVARAKADGERLTRGRLASAFTREGALPAALLVDRFDGNQQVMCMFYGEPLAEVAARGDLLEPWVPTIAQNIRHDQETDQLDGIEVVTDWISLIRPEGATAKTVAPDAILVSLTFPQPDSH